MFLARECRRCSSCVGAALRHRGGTAAVDEGLCQSRSETVIFRLIETDVATLIYFDIALLKNVAMLFLSVWVCDVMLLLQKVLLSY